MMVSFSALGGDFPSIALVVLHSLVGSDCGPASPRTVSMFVSDVVHLLLLSTHTSMHVWRCPSILLSDGASSYGFLTGI